MSSDGRAQLLVCYEDQKEKIFHNKLEILAYCMDDVNVLRKACWRLEICFEIGKDGPFRKAITISSICK